MTVSTHSRPKAAGSAPRNSARPNGFQHTAARRRLGFAKIICLSVRQFQHTAARRRLASEMLAARKAAKFQHTAARRRLAVTTAQSISCYLFQHTAARRRLAWFCPFRIIIIRVSTHSRPKAAGEISGVLDAFPSFNTQPPEGGW